MDGVLYLKKVWYRGYGAQKKVIELLKEDEVVVAFHTKKLGRGWTNICSNSLLKLINKNRGLYEVLVTYPKKVYFDIDFETPPEDFNQSIYLDTIINKIKKYLPDIEFAISGSVSPDKASFHLVAQNYIIKNEEQLATIKIIAKALFLENEEIDWKVYTKNRQMKIINQSKPNKPVQLPISNHEPSCHLINSFINRDSFEISHLSTLPEQSLIMADLASKNTIKELEIIPMNLPNPDNITWDELGLKENATKLLSLIPTGEKFNHNHTYRVCNFCISNDIPKAMFLSWLKQKDPNNLDRIDKYNKIHYEQIKNQLNKNKNYAVSIHRMRSFLPNWYPNIKPKNIEIKNFKKNWIPNDITYIDKIDINSINVTEKFLFYSNPMGMGKTNMLIEYLKNNNHHDFIWIAPRITLLDDTHERMIKQNIDVTHYKKLGSKKNKEFVLKFKEKTKNLLICLNSIHYLCERDYMPDIIIIDEIETILSALCNSDTDFISINIKQDILRSLKLLINCASKVICLDAFTTKRAVDFILSFESETELKNHIIYDTKINKKKPVRNIIHVKGEFDNIVKNIIKNILDGERVVLFYPFKNFYKTYDSMDMLIEKIKKMLIHKGYKGDVENDIIHYNADSKQSKKNTIKDVNLNWENKKLVVFNQIITAGVSYSNPNAIFDKTYMVIAPFNSPRDIAQVSYRFRMLITNDIYLHYTKGKRPEAWKNDTDEVNCIQYTKLFKNSMIEFKSPLRQTLMLFFKRCNYDIKQPINEIGIEDAINDNEKASEEQSDLYSFDSIPVINENIFKDIIQRQVLGDDIETSESLAVRKYVFMSHFKKDTPSRIFKHIWNNDKINIVNIVHSAITDQNSFESKLAKENDWEFFPYIEEATKRWNVNISDETKKQILNEWELLRYKNDKRALLKTIYNTKYKTGVINTEGYGKEAIYNTEEVEYLNDLALELKEYYCGKTEH